MSCIWKFELDACVTDAAVRMPKGAQILTLQMQNNRPHLWAMVMGPIDEYEVRRFLTMGTAEFPQFPIGTDLIYVGTYQVDAYVGHVFEVRK